MTSPAPFRITAPRRRRAALALFAVTAAAACESATSDGTGEDAADLGVDAKRQDAAGSGGTGSGGQTGGAGGTGGFGGPGGQSGGGQTGGGQTGGNGGDGGHGGTPGALIAAPAAPCELPSGPDARQADYDVEMGRFVARIQAYAACRKPGFMVFPQNAPELARLPGYLDFVAGIGKEDLYYGADADAEPTDAEQTREWEADLDLFTAAGKLVLSVDYPFTDEDVPDFDAETRARIDEGYRRAGAKGYAHYASVRNLGYPTVNPGHEPDARGAPVTTTAAVNDWLYLLQPPEDLERAEYVDLLSDQRFDLLVIDAEWDGEVLTGPELAAVHMNAGALVISYLSIGEAETYRAYWNPRWDANGDGRPDAGAPAWLGESNPDWPDNYKVRYWMPGWQALMLTRIDELIDAGFDGVYLDIIDAWECFDSGECRE
ncbi:endo alpha-1,4 polygalactosaminidase [Myxococcota bacterium]|nr:endo alpha-1,4 polygalactosaminidase [Myxococcota bacterium]